MTVRSYYSTDTSAPVLTGEPGTLIALLEQCLVLGYGSKSPAGWIKAHSQTNVGVYQAPTGSTELLLQVIDDGSGAPGYAAALVRGYEAMSNAVTGERPFPTLSQEDEFYAQKSYIEDSSHRAWELHVDDKAFYYFVAPRQETYGLLHGGMFFGDIISKRPSDSFHCGLLASGNSFPAYPGQYWKMLTLSSWNQTNDTGMFLARRQNQLEGAIEVPRVGLAGITSVMGAQGPPYPSPIHNGLDFADVLVGESSSGIRGKMPGLYHPLADLQAADVPHGTTIDNIAGLDGRTIRLVRVGYSSGNVGYVGIDLTGPWE